MIGNDLLHNCAGVLPSDVTQANRTAKMQELDTQLAGLFVTRAAISNVPADTFDDFLELHVEALSWIARENATPIEERLARVRARYRLI
ncbi:hypothetical protein [Ruegeria hyattellae]|uniref:hypothetical protein n=1 Tax=Ruegeria hyattellae TaxID=3233337 RepID=UPI00355B6290